MKAGRGRRLADALAGGQPVVLSLFTDSGTGPLGEVPVHLLPPERPRFPRVVEQLLDQVGADLAAHLAGADPDSPALRVTIDLANLADPAGPTSRYRLTVAGTTWTDEPDDLAGPGLAGHQQADTAADAGAADFGGQRRAVLDYARDVGPFGITARDLAYAELVPSTNIGGSRLLELRGGTATHRTRWVARVVDADGALVRRDGCAVHVATDQQLPDGWSWEQPDTVRLCGSCGQAVRSRPRGDEIHD